MTDRVDDMLNIRDNTPKDKSATEWAARAFSVLSIFATREGMIGRNPEQAEQTFIALLAKAPEDVTLLGSLAILEALHKNNKSL